jgi:hypothetical protein
MPRPKPDFTLEDAAERVMTALDRQTEELSVYPSTPHTAENQSRILTTLDLLKYIRQLQDWGPDADS